MAKDPKAKPLKPPKPLQAPAPPPGPARGGLPVAGLAERLTGSQLCYGEPIRDAGRTVIPVARVRAAGGWGFGRGPTDQGGGGGGGGALDALPIGYVEIGPEGTRFQRIEDPEAATRAIRTLTAAAVTLATAFAGLRAARGRRRLGRGR